MMSYELEEIKKRIYDLNMKIEYLFEHPAIQELNRQVEDLQRRIKAINEEITNIKQP